KVDKSAWRVAIQDPANAEAFLGILSTEDKAVITSGGYERYFEENGKKYHHIIDVKTGYPADSGLTSVSIVAKDGTLADGLSTSLFIMGEEKAKNYWREHRKEFEAILYKEDGSVYITEGLEGNFESEHPLYVIK
ncbi:MAG TPA: FAD:protein FMN transferase, partial [Lachnospiraceae bacterium]